MWFVELAILIGILLADSVRSAKWLRNASDGGPPPTFHRKAGRITGALGRLAASGVFVVAAVAGNGWGHIGAAGLLTVHLFRPTRDFAVGFMDGVAPGSQHTNPRLTAGAGVGFLAVAMAGAIFVFSTSTANPPLVPLIAASVGAGIASAWLERFWFIRHPFAPADPDS